MRLGSHLSIQGGKEKALEHAKLINCESLQIFTRNARTWAAKPLTKEEIELFVNKKEELKEKVWPLLSHNSYLINLASTDDEKLYKSFNAMVDEIKKADQLKLDYLVIHPGVILKEEKIMTEKDALLQIANQLNNLILNVSKKSRLKILIENTAGHGRGLGKKFEDISTILSNIENKNRIGVCFDTCHAFASGIDFTTKAKYEKMLEDFDNVIGLNYLDAFHLNDAEKELGSQSDRHTHIGQGKIGTKAFGFFLNDKRFEDHPGILETPKGKDDKLDIMNLKTLRSLIK